MITRPLAAQLRALPRSAALRRPTASSTLPRRFPAVVRSYSATQPRLSEAKEKTIDEEEAEALKQADALEGKVKDLEKDILYHRAEIQTLNRRVADERAKASEFAISSFARNLLSTADVLSTALSHVPKPIDESNTALAQLVSGVELTQKAMYKTFEQHGVRKMEVSRGTPFDPNLHEATFQIPKEVAGPRGDGQEWGSGEVVEVGKEGWTIGGRVLRPAQVGVTQIE